MYAAVRVGRDTRGNRTPPCKSTLGRSRCAEDNEIDVVGSREIEERAAHGNLEALNACLGHVGQEGGQQWTYPMVRGGVNTRKALASPDIMVDCCLARERLMRH